MLRAGLALALALVAGCGGEDPPQYVIVPERDATPPAFADATNASGLESFSDPVRVVTSPKASGDEGARSPGRRNPISGVVEKESGRP